LAGQYPQQQIPGITILGVRPDSTKTGKPIFKIQTSDGQERSTFDSQAANAAQAMVGQTGTLIISVNGQWQNYESFQPGGVAAPAQGFGAPPAQTFGAPVPQQQFTPAPGFTDGKEARIIRGNALNAAAATIGPFVASGFFVTEDGHVQTEDIAGITVKIAKLYVKYLTDEGAAQAQTAEAPVFPPGVTPDMVAAWLQTQGAPVVVGAPVAAAQDASAEAADPPSEEGKLY